MSESFRALDHLGEAQLDPPSGVDGRAYERAEQNLDFDVFLSMSRVQDAIRCLCEGSDPKRIIGDLKRLREHYEAAVMIQMQEDAENGGDE